VVTGALSSVLVGIAITVASGRWPGSMLRLFRAGLVGDLGNACFAIVAVYILTVDWRAAWLLVVIAAVLVFAYRSFEGARQRSESLEQVNRFTALVGREVELESVVRTVLTEVREAFGVATVVIRLALPGGGSQDWVLRDGPVAVGRAALVDALAAVAAGQPLLVPRRTRDAALGEAIEREGVHDSMLVPLHGEGTVIGWLVAADTLGDIETFGRADLTQLVALANHAAVAIGNATRASLIIAQAEERERQALHDELTGLANRRLLGVHLGETLRDRPAAVLALGLDRFKDVNETLGHELGDELLRLVAARLEQAVPAGALVARTGGDQFAVLLPGEDEPGVRGCAALVQAALGEAFALAGVSVATEASFGAAVAVPGTAAATVLRWADLSLAAAKSRRTALEVYRPELDRTDRVRLGLLTDLRAAVAGGELSVHYQPKVDLSTGRAVGVEALARWDHPVHGRVAPDQFIPLAEQSTLITPLTMLILRTALGDCRRWQQLTPGFSVAVNISARSLLEPSFVDQVAAVLAGFEMAPSSLTLELTETSLMTDPERAIAALERLRAVGVRLSVDDLGTGYSSLAYLQRLPVDEIKIDRSFVSVLPEPSSVAIIGAIVDLGHRLGHSVVAEGIEDAVAFGVLRDVGCDLAQGYWMSRPLPAAELDGFLVGYQAPLPVLLREAG
ncbi:MAG: sensor domain-containing phosphodiesterase, partial [Nocardioidaceae bacterium]